MTSGKARIRNALANRSNCATILLSATCSEGMAVKKCIVCGVELNKETTTWYRQKNYIHKCNDCTRAEKREQAARFRRENKSATRERCAKYRMRMKANDPVKYTSKQMAGSASKRAGALGLDYNLNTDFIVSICPAKCPVFGFELKYGGGDKTKRSASIDRIDSDKGYTMDNVMIISSLANTMKSNATNDELLAFAEWVMNKS